MTFLSHVGSAQKIKVKQLTERNREWKVVASKSNSVYAFENGVLQRMDSTFKLVKQIRVDSLVLFEDFEPDAYMLVAEGFNDKLAMVATFRNRKQFRSYLMILDDDLNLVQEPIPFSEGEIHVAFDAIDYGAFKMITSPGNKSLLILRQANYYPFILPFIVIPNSFNDLEFVVVNEAFEISKKLAIEKGRLFKDEPSDANYFTVDDVGNVAGILDYQNEYKAWTIPFESGEFETVDFEQRYRIKLIQYTMTFVGPGKLVMTGIARDREKKFLSNCYILYDIDTKESDIKTYKLEGLKQSQKSKIKNSPNNCTRIFDDGSLVNAYTMGNRNVMITKFDGTGQLILSRLIFARKPRRHKGYMKVVFLSADSTLAVCFDYVAPSALFIKDRTKKYFRVVYYNNNTDEISEIKKVVHNKRMKPFLILSDPYYDSWYVDQGTVFIETKRPIFLKLFEVNKKPRELNNAKSRTKKNNPE